jgi:hypothetical protein
VQGIKDGLSGLCVLSGQVIISDSSIHDCTYGVEVQEDGHAYLERSTISFCTECALVCEGHSMLNRCQIFANSSAFTKGAAPSVSGRIDEFKRSESGFCAGGSTYQGLGFIL